MAVADNSSSTSLQRVASRRVVSLSSGYYLQNLSPQYKYWIKSQYNQQSWYKWNRNTRIVIRIESGGKWIVTPLLWTGGAGGAQRTAEVWQTATDKYRNRENFSFKKVFSVTQRWQFMFANIIKCPSHQLPSCPGIMAIASIANAGMQGSSTRLYICVRGYH